MHTILVGINYKSADIHIREKLHFDPEVVPAALRHLVSYPSVNGCVILSTCNRTEIYCAAHDIDLASKEILSFLRTYNYIDEAAIAPYLYKKHCKDAVMHLFNVTASLDSMVIGENQILTQVKHYYFIAKNIHATDAILNKVFQTAIHVGKKIRAKTRINNGSVSVGSVAVELLQQLAQTRTIQSILLIGAGKTSEITIKNIRNQIPSKVGIANRSKERATALANTFDAYVIPFEDRYNAIQNYDVIIVSTGAENYILSGDTLAEHNIADKKIFIDLSVPRNIDPSVKNSGFALYTVDDLQGIINQNVEKRNKEITKVKTIINTIYEDYYRWYIKQTILNDKKVTDSA